MSKYPLGKIYQHEAKLMATQYTDILKLALPVQGELTGTWGDTVNDEITSMVEQAIAGRTTVTSWTANSHTLTVIEGATSESRAAILNITDPSTSLTGAGTVICPTQSKIYIVENNTVRTITVKTSAGTGISIPSGLTGLIFCDGTNVEDGLTYLPYDNSSSGLTATNVQAAIDELDTAVDLNTASRTALGTPATTGIALLNDETASDARTTLGLGTAAVKNVDNMGNLTVLNLTASGEVVINDGPSFGELTMGYNDSGGNDTVLKMGYNLPNYGWRIRQTQVADNEASGTFNIERGTASSFVSALSFDNEGNATFENVVRAASGIYLGGTADANKLDDYEEGTWTPTLPNGGTLTVSSAQYTKIGRMVTLTFFLNDVNPTNNSSQFNIGGIPFNANGSNVYFGGSWGYAGNGTYNDFMPVMGFNFIYFHRSSSANPVSNSEFIAKSGSLKAVVITISYSTNS